MQEVRQKWQTAFYVTELVHKDVEPCDESKVAMDVNIIKQGEIEPDMAGEKFMFSSPVNSVVRQELPQAVQRHQGQLGGDDVLVDGIPKFGHSLRASSPKLAPCGAPTGR